MSFTALLDFTQSASVKTSHDCEINAVYDLYKGVCRKLLCPPLSVLDNGTCRRVVSAATGLTFKATIQLTASAPTRNFDHGRLGQELEKYFNNITENYTTEASVTLRHKNYSDSMNTHLDANIDVFVAFIEFKDDINFADRLIDFHDSVIYIPSSGFTELPKVEINKTNLRFRYFSPNTQRRNAKFLTEIKIPPFSYQNPTLEANVVVSKFLKCEMIELNLEKFDVHINESGIYFQGLKLFLSNNDFIESNESYIRVCARDYMPYTAKFNVIGDSSPSFTNILSIVCACLSVVSLIITLIVYGLLTELRTQPGLNNMFLSISLLVAFLGLFIGGIQSITGFWCSIIGLLVHFLWLNSVFWLNICCYHMFKTFGTIRVPVEKKTSWVYHAYCLVNSTVLININIIWSLAASDGATIGYGKHSGVCYIFYPHMIGYTMTLPVGIVVVSNIIMYGTVIYKIRKDSFRTSCQSGRRHFSVYIKLSTVTGFSWLSFIPAIPFRNTVFDAVVSMLVACQGVYIMLAFVCNRRVLVLLKTFILEREISVNSTVSTNRNKTQEKTFMVNKERDTTTTLV